MEASAHAQLHALISGRVQGVFFRGATMREARSLGLRGWVRNLSDGRVELVAEGARRNLEMLLAWAHQGPPGARVLDVSAQWLPHSGLLPDFEVR